MPGTADTAIEGHYSSATADRHSHLEDDHSKEALLHRDVQSAIAAAKQTLAEQVERLASAARSVGRQTCEADPELGACVDEFAAALGTFSGYLSRTELTDLLGDAERHLRARPALLIGGAVLAGLALAGAARTLTGDSSPTATSRNVPRKAEPDSSASPSPAADVRRAEMALAAPLPTAHQPGKMSPVSNSSNP